MFIDFSKLKNTKRDEIKWNTNKQRRLADQRLIMINYIPIITLILSTYAVTITLYAVHTSKTLKMCT